MEHEGKHNFYECLMKPKFWWQMHQMMKFSIVVYKFSYNARILRYNQNSLVLANSCYSINRLVAGWLVNLPINDDLFGLPRYGNMRMVGHSLGNQWLASTIFPIGRCAIPMCSMFNFFPSGVCICTWLIAWCLDPIEFDL